MTWRPTKKGVELLHRLAVPLVRGERGQAFVAVLILLGLGGLMLPPLLDLASTSLLTEEVHETSLRRFYTADSGVEDALWQIKADELSTLFPDYDRYAYSDYDGTSYAYSDYSATASAPDLNSMDLDITIENVWVPYGIDAPSPTEAQQILDDSKLVVSGSVTDAGEYRIRITYNHEQVTDPDWDELAVDQIGIWLPPGFTYVADSSNLEEDPWDDYYCVPTTQPYKSGQVVLWDFSPNVLFTDMPEVVLGDYPLIASIEFEYLSSSGRNPDAAVSWTTTTGVDDVDYAWDADVSVFKIESEATDPVEGATTTVEAYTARGELRRISAAIDGDYYATGNSLITSTDSNDDYLNRLWKESAATVATDDNGEDGVPAQGIPEAVYLYWTGWIDWHDYDPTGAETTIFFDECTHDYSGGDDFDNWNEGGNWGLSSQYSAFWAQGGGSNWDKIMTLRDSIDLSDYTDDTVTVSWRVWRGGSLESNDCFEFQMSGDDGSTWGNAEGVSGAIETAFCDDSTFGSSPGSGRRLSYTIPATYLTDEFSIRFRANFSSSNDYIYFDEFSVTAQSTGSGGSLRYPDTPTAENLRQLIEDTARTSVVLLDAGGSAPVEISADMWEIEPTTGAAWEDTWSYCCFADVTEQVRDWIDDGYLNNNASGTYTLGHNVAENEVDPDFSFDLYVPYGPDEETGYPLGTPSPSPSSPPTRYNYSHAGWSIIVIYTSPETAGHQLYLFDIQDPAFDFTEAWAPAGYPNPDFDGDGEGGGRVSGFLVPDPVGEEEIAAKMTVFVGEGDSLINGDEIEVNGTNLSNSLSPWNNVWNSASPGVSEDGVDIDTFVIEWDDNIVEPGDSSAEIDLPTGSDGFNLVYIILSFRSEVTTGGTISFLLSG